MVQTIDHDVLLLGLSCCVSLQLFQDWKNVISSLLDTFHEKIVFSFLLRILLSPLIYKLIGLHYSVGVYTSLHPVDFVTMVTFFMLAPTCTNLPSHFRRDKN